VSRADDVARRHRPPAPRPQLPQALSGLVHQARLRGVQLLVMPPGAAACGGGRGAAGRAGGGGHGRAAQSRRHTGFGAARHARWPCPLTATGRAPAHAPPLQLTHCILPAGMQRRRESTTFYNFRARKLQWRVEWAFPEADPEAAAALPPRGAGGDDGAGAGVSGGTRAPRLPQRWQPQLPAKRRRADEAAEGPAAGSNGGSGDGGGGGSGEGGTGSSGGGGSGLVLVDERVDDDRPLRALLEAHLAPGPGAGARRLALRAYVDAASGDVGVLPVLMRREHCPVGCHGAHSSDNMPCRAAMGGGHPRAPSPSTHPPPPTPPSPIHSSTHAPTPPSRPTRHATTA
jgi:hypothetical protein